MIFKLLNWQGMAGIAASIALAILLVVQKGETHHWKKASAGFEQLYREEQSAFATTVANYRAAADQARAADQANAVRVAAEQRTVNERTDHDFATRLAAAHAAAQRLYVAPRPQPIPVLAEAHQCPAYPLPPADLLKLPVKTDFLTPTR